MRADRPFKLSARSKPLVALAVLALVAWALVACSSEDGSDADAAGEGGGSGSSAESLVVYSGRSEELVEPLFERFTEETGIDLEVRYGDSADLALAIDEEGDRGQADVFFSQSPGAIGFLSANDRLAELSTEVLDRVPPEDRSAEGYWVGVSGRARVLVANPEEVDVAALPSSVFDLTKPEYKGRVAVAPTNGSFIDFVSGMRQAVGDQRTEEWLAGMAANESPNYANNNAILEAVSRGEVPMGLANHYYLERAKVENPDISAVNHFFASGDPGSLLLVSAAAVTATSEKKSQAEELVAFLLSEESQRYFAEETFEYPLVAGVAPAGDLPPLTDLPVTRIDLDQLGSELTSTLDMIRESGIQQ